MLNYYKRVGQLMWKDFRASMLEQIIGALVAFAILVCQVHFGLIKNQDIRASVWSICWPYLLLGAIFFLVHLVRAPWKLDRLAHDAINGLTSEIKKEKARNQKPDIHIQVLEGLLLSTERDGRGKTVIGLFSQEVALYLKLENHRNIPTTIADAFLRLRAEGREYQCDNPTTGYDRRWAVTQSGKNKELFDLDVLGTEPLQYAHHDHGWIMFKLGGLTIMPVVDANVEVTVVDGLGNQHKSDWQNVKLIPALYAQ